MARKKKDNNSTRDYLYKPFVLAWNHNDFYFEDIEDWLKRTKISGAIVIDLIEGHCKEAMGWSISENFSRN